MAKIKQKTETTEAQPTKNGYIVWLKSRAYINDTERIDAGVYYFDEVPQRLASMGKDVCVVFEGEVPSKELAQIARWSGVNPDGRQTDELLKILVGKPVIR